MNIGQYRKETIPYMINKSYNIINIENTNDTMENSISFIDKGIKVVGSSVVDLFQEGKSYYLKFDIFKSNSVMDIDVILINDLIAEDNSQYINSYTIPKGASNQKVSFEVAFCPNANYNCIIFQLKRTFEDYQLGGREIFFDRSYLKLYSLIDIMPKLNGVSFLEKIGIQGTPGLLMVINGEEIKIGKNGIFEIMNSIRVESICFAIEQNDDNYFIIDYQY